MTTAIDVEALTDSRLRVRLSNGHTIEVDVSEYLNEPNYESLGEPALFARVTVAEWGHGVCWPGDIGIPIDALSRLAKEQNGQAWPTRFFDAWMKRNGMSIAETAGAFGLTQRTITKYHCGAKPIPIYIGLACEGWEHRNSEKK